MTRVRYLAALILAACAVASPVAAQKVRVSRGYLTPKDVADPSSLSVQRNDSTWLTKFDGALILATSAAGLRLPSVTVEAGYFASVGTIRDKKARVHGPWGGLTFDLVRVLTDGKIAWETTTDAKIRAYTGTIRISPLTWRSAGVGVPVTLAKVADARLHRPSPGAGPGTYVELSWRPYVGFQAGKLQRAPEPIEVGEGERFTRLMGNVDALVRVVRLVRFPADPATHLDSTKFVSLFELSGKATGWRLQAIRELRSQFVVGITVPVNEKLKIKLDWEKARKPPAFKAEQSVSLGVGLAW